MGQLYVLEILAINLASVLFSKHVKWMSWSSLYRGFLRTFVVGLQKHSIRAHKLINVLIYV